MAEYTAVVRMPPDTVDDAHDFLEGVWQARPDVGPDDRIVIETSLSELVTNVIQNNPHRQVLCEVTLSIGPGTIVLDTADTGDKVAGLPGPGMPAADAEHGRGLALIGLMADHLDYRHDGVRNHWRVEKSRPAAS